MSSPDRPPLKKEVDPPRPAARQPISPRWLILTLPSAMAIFVICLMLRGDGHDHAPNSVPTVKLEVRISLVELPDLGGYARVRHDPKKGTVDVCGCYYVPLGNDPLACEPAWLPYDRLEIAGFVPLQGEDAVLGCVHVGGRNAESRCRRTNIRVPRDELRATRRGPAAMHLRAINPSSDAACP